MNELSQNPQLNIPVVNARNWFEKYPELPNYQFSWDICGIHTGDTWPFGQHTSGENHLEIYPIDKDWEPIGYCLETAIRPRPSMVAIMFENKKDFRKVWFHYVR